MLTTITVDVGTTSVKLGLFDPSGVALALSKATTPTVADGWGEVYDHDALLALVVDFCRGLTPAQRAGVERVALTGVGESGGLVRPDASLVSPLIVWHDQRGAEFIRRLSPTDRDEIYRVSGLPANPNYGLSKIAWVLEHASGPTADAQWLTVPEYLAARLTGSRWAEYSLASRTMALDVRSRTWSSTLAARAGTTRSTFPPLHDARHSMALIERVATEMGLSPHVQVHVAGHDHMVGAIGAGLRSGELLNSTGTTEGLLMLNDSPALDDAASAAMLANGLSCNGAAYTLFASIPTGGSAFAALQRLTGQNSHTLSATIQELDAHYRSGRIAWSDLPVVLPQFRGSPPPTKVKTARGAIIRVGEDTTATELIMGCFIGMVMQFREVMDLFPQRPSAVKVIGPASTNPLWLQLKADLLGTVLSVSNVPEVVSLGAQALASSTRRTWDQCEPREVEPDARRHAVLSRYVEDISPLWTRMKALTLDDIAPRPSHGGATS